MKQNKKVGLLGLVACALLLNTQANAQMFDQDSQTKKWSKSAWYIGAGLGQSRTSIDEQRLVRSLMDNGANSVMFTKDERDLGYKLFLGKQLNEKEDLELLGIVLKVERRIVRFRLREDRLLLGRFEPAK